MEEILFNKTIAMSQDSSISRGCVKIEPKDIP